MLHLCIIIILSAKVFAGARSSLIEANSEEAFFGETSVKIQPSPRTFRQSGTNDILFPTSLQVESAIPNTRITFVCHVFLNTLLYDSVIVDIPGKQQQVASEISKPCNYHGHAVLSTLPDQQSRCLVSLCGNLQHGTVWLPTDGDDVVLHFELDETLSKARFQSTLPKALVLNDDLFLQSKQNKQARLTPQQQLLVDTYPPDWYHLRIAVLVSVETYQSSLFKNDTASVVDFLASSMGLMNAVWSKLNVTVHLTGVIIWQDYDQGDEVQQMPGEDWNKPDRGVSVIAPLAKVAETYLWPRHYKSADFIVAFRNAGGSKYQAAGVSSTGSLCRGMFANEPAFGSILAVQTARHPSLNNTVVDFAATVVHELGHTVGYSHDIRGYDCSCRPDGSPHQNDCIMAERMSRNLYWAWTDCFIRQFKTHVQQLPYGCLKQIPRPILMNRPNTCGNGIVEIWEDCDCGQGPLGTDLPAELRSIFCGNSTCCNQTTCKVAEFAQCAYGPCCNLETCNYVSSATTCRKGKMDECDFDERCNGTSQHCPEDRYMMTGTKCGFNLLGSCHEGNCFTRNQYCQVIFGTNHHNDSDSINTCYLLNKEGSNATNCGHGLFRSNTSETTFTPCDNENKECGNLICNGYDRAVVDQHFLHFHKTIQYNHNLTCSMIAGPMFPDYGHVPDGMPCSGGTKYCLNQQCVEKPKCQFPPCDNKGNHVPEEGYIGTSKVIFRYAAGDRPPSPTYFPKAIILETKIPNTTVDFKCQLLISRRLSEVPKAIIFERGKMPEMLPINACNYNGSALFSSSSVTSKCVLSLCPGFQFGVVWLPLGLSNNNDEQSFLQFDLSDDFTTASFTSSLRQNAGRSVDDRSLVVFNKNATGNLHFRIAVFIPHESLRTPFLNHNVTTAVNFVTSSFGLINAIWSPLNIDIHLTNIIISKTVNAKSEFAESHWYEDHYSLFMHGWMASFAENTIWPSLGNSADYIVVIRNMDRELLPKQLGKRNVFGFASANSVCQGRIAGPPALGAMIVVSTRFRHAKQHVLTDFVLVTSHHLGEAFGMENDVGFANNNCRCGDGDDDTLCIMNPLGRSLEFSHRYLHFAWSNCSVDAVELYRKKLPPPCLEVVPSLSNLPDTNQTICGNGVVEIGEECDCGPISGDMSQIYCPNPTCCNRQTCRLAENAQCISGSCCNVSTCSFFGSNKMCRGVRSDQCDLPEFCNGTSSDCPDDRYLMTGTRCQVHDFTDLGSCHEGYCWHLDARCMEVTGTRAALNRHDCALLNQGTGLFDFVTNCGHGWFKMNPFEIQFQPCREQDLECGNLMCHSFKTSVLETRFHYYYQREDGPLNKTKCASIASPVVPDYGHVPDGMLCNADRGYCEDHRCVPLPTCTEQPPCDQNGNHVDGFWSTVSSTETVTTTAAVPISGEPSIPRSIAFLLLPLALLVPSIFL